jgi:hypothetical protein
LPLNSMVPALNTRKRCARRCSGSSAGSIAQGSSSLASTSFASMTSASVSEASVLGGSSDQHCEPAASGQSLAAGDNRRCLRSARPEAGELIKARHGARGTIMCRRWRS